MSFNVRPVLLVSAVMQLLPAIVNEPSPEQTPLMHRIHSPVFGVLQSHVAFKSNDDIALNVIRGLPLPALIEKSIRELAPATSSMSP
jgi:hypothetical protein